MRFFLFFMGILLLLVGCVPENMNESSKKTSTENSIDATSFLRIHYIDVGQADATLLQIKDHDELITMLIDTGDWNRSDVVSYLKAENIQDIDLIVITHPHADHIGQLANIIEDFHVGEVWMNGDLTTSQVFSNALQAIEQSGVDYYEPTAGEVFDIGDLTINIVHPGELSLNTNNNSIAMHMQYDDISFLFTGDAEQAAEEEMLLGNTRLKADILHIGHHGSNTSNTAEFLEAVNAETGIYSAGVGNSYGHPDDEIIERLKNRKMDIYGTDKDGTIVLETDGKTYRMMTDKQNNLPVPLKGKACVDINTASAEELQKITHVGEVTASSIIELRPYHSITDLLDVKGIGPERFQAIQEQNLACIGG